MPFLLLSIIACKQTAKTGSDANCDWNTLDKSEYSVQYPSTWELNESGSMGTSFILFSQLESENDEFRENINLMIQDLSGQNIDLDKYTEMSEEQVKAIITNYTLMESERIKDDRGEFHKIIYSGDQGQFHLIFEHYYWVVNEKAYLLTFVSEQDKFADFKEEGEGILNSFKLK